MSTHVPHRAFLLCPGMFEDPRLRSLRSSRPNRDRMFETLADERHGLCERTDITVMSNEPHSAVKPRLEQWFASATSDETLVFYYSGHGLASPDAELRLATATAGEHGSHAIAGSELAAWISTSRARQLFVIVDAVHAGPQDVRTDGRVYQLIGSGDSVDVDAPAGQASAFTEWIAAWFATSPAPTLVGLFEALHGPQPLQIVPQTSEPIAAAPVVVAPSDETIRVDLAPTPPQGAPAPTVAPRATMPATAMPTTAMPTPAMPRTAAAAPPPVFLAAPADRRKRGWMVAASAVLLVAGVAGALTRCGGDEEADSPTPTSTAVATTPTTTVDTASVPTSVALPGAGTTVAVSVETTSVPADVTTLPATTAVASAAPITAAPTTVAAPGTVELGIPNHPLAKPACTGGWIAQLASVDATSEYARASVEDLLGTTGSSYTYAPESCSTFDKGGNWYVVYLGPFATKADAQAACKAAADEDCFPRQLQ